ncbi:MAG: UDP-glucose 4-epimerase GalE [Planctomycetota bacterium]|nr:MAG: UDP-glucose 4-epimerase GalE [Planctomycetota bacterium]
MLRILVTGGCGYIGSAAARLLAREGHAVTVVDDLSEGHRQAWDGELVVADLLDEDAVRKLAQRRFDGVIHFAARAYVGESVQQPLRYWRANLVPLIHLCAALEGVPVVLSSTCAVFGLPQAPALAEDHPQAPVNPYGATKAAAERLLADRAAAGQGAYAALRYFNAAGADADGRHGEDHRPETHLIPRAIAAALGRAPALTIYGADWDTPDGTCVRDFVHVEDLAAAHLRALERLARGGSSGCWNLGTGRGHSVREVLGEVERALGAPVPWNGGPRRPGDPPYLVAQPARARADLSWQARHDLPSIVASAVGWHRRHPNGYTP